MLDIENGIMHSEMHCIEPLTGDINTSSKSHAIEYRNTSINHAMLITGCHIDSNEKKPVKWQVENSHGTKHGREPTKGYLTMSNCWFERYGFQIVIHRKHLNSSHLEALQKCPIELPPWDILGQLATVI